MTTSEQALEALSVLAMDPDQSVEFYHALIMEERRLIKEFCEALRTGSPAPGSKEFEALANELQDLGDRALELNTWMMPRLVGMFEKMFEDDG